MLNDRSIVAVIPARGGSKGVPRKNVRPLAGKPLIAWTIEAAKRSRFLDKVIVSSEDPEILDVARSWGAETPFVRPMDLALDDTPGMAPIFHALDCLPSYDIVVELQPTSPLRTTGDIDGCLKRMADAGAPSVITISPSDVHPAWIFTMDPQGRLAFLNSRTGKPLRRQEGPALYYPTGSVFAAEVGHLRANGTFYTPQTIGYVIPKQRAIDINDEQDFRMCELLMSFN